MKELIVVNHGQVGCQAGDSLWEQLAIENNIIDQKVITKDGEFAAKPFFYETQTQLFVPRTIFLNSENVVLRRKLYGKQNFASLRLMMEKSDNLQGLIIVGQGKLRKNQTIEEELEAVNYLPQYHFHIQGEPFNIQSLVDSISAYSEMRERAETAVLLQNWELKQPMQQANKQVATIMSNCLASVNQPFKKMLDVTQFNQHLVFDDSHKFLTAGYDVSHTGAYSNSGINYQNGKFISSGLVVRGESNQEGLALVKQLTSLNSLSVGLLEKPYPGVTQISNHTSNLEWLESDIQKFSRAPKQFIKSEVNVDESLGSLLDAYRNTV